MYVYEKNGGATDFAMMFQRNQNIKKNLKNAYHDFSEY